MLTASVPARGLEPAYPNPVVDVLHLPKPAAYTVRDLLGLVLLQALVSLGGYLVLAGSIGAAISSTAVQPGEQLDEAQSRQERMGGSSAETL